MCHANFTKAYTGTTPVNSINWDVVSRKMQLVPVRELASASPGLGCVVAILPVMKPHWLCHSPNKTE